MWALARVDPRAGRRRGVVRRRAPRARLGNVSRVRWARCTRSRRNHRPSWRRRHQASRYQWPPATGAVDSRDNARYLHLAVENGGAGTQLTAPMSTLCLISPNRRGGTAVGRHPLAAPARSPCVTFGHHPGRRTVPGGDPARVPSIPVLRCPTRRRRADGRRPRPHGIGSCTSTIAGVTAWIHRRRRR